MNTIHLICLFQYEIYNNRSDISIVSFRKEWKWPSFNGSSFEKLHLSSCVQLPGQINQTLPLYLFCHWASKLHNCSICLLFLSHKPRPKQTFLIHNQKLLLAKSAQIPLFCFVAEFGIEGLMPGCASELIDLEWFAAFHHLRQNGVLVHVDFFCISQMLDVCFKQQ